MNRSGGVPTDIDGSCQKPLAGDTSVSQRTALFECLEAAFQREAALQGRISQLELRYEELQGARSLRLAQMLAQACGSWAGFFALPGQMLQLFVRSKQQSEDVSCVLQPPDQHSHGWRKFEPASTGSALRMLAVVDEFTQQTLIGECFLGLPDTRLDCAFIDEFKPDLLFVESAWRGNGGSWRDALNEHSAAFHELLQACRVRGIPTVFWNKEDPVHRDHFFPLARHFDLVLTTDAGSLPFYERELGGGRCGVMKFSAQPRINNPLESRRRAAAMFAGSYYPQYPERNSDLIRMVEKLAGRMSVDIYDRNLNSGDSAMLFPEPLSSYVVGTLSPEKIAQAYREYSFAITVNTVTDSSTMLARRVYELAASGTVVVSNPSLAISGEFGDAILQADAEGNWLERLDALVFNEDVRFRHALRAMRHVFSNSTWAHRLAWISTRLDLGATASRPRIVCLAPVCNQEQLSAVLADFRQQNLSDAHLLVLGDVSVPADTGDLIHSLSVEDAAAYINSGDWLVGWWHGDWHGPNHLVDLVHAMYWGEFQGATRGCFWRSGAAGPVHEGIGFVHARVGAGGARRSLWSCSNVERLAVWVDAIKTDQDLIGSFSSINDLGYCADSRVPPLQAIE